MNTEGQQNRDLLIVDDDPAQTYLVEHLLARMGMPLTCHSASSGRQALDYLRRLPPYEKASSPDLVILDINMPGINGCEVLREIKGDPGLCRIPVIMFSLAGSEEFDTCYRDKANACVRKPYGYEENLRVLRNIIEFWFQIVQLPV